MEHVQLPKDEMPHEGQAIEWWYFNGFIGKKAFMHCLFKADKEKVNLSFLKIPVKTIYFSHSLLFDLEKKKVEKEVLPVVLVSEDSFKREELFLNYFYPVRKSFVNYEIARHGKELRLKTRFYDLWMQAEKKPMLQGNRGLLNLGNKSTYYYSYPRLKAKGIMDGRNTEGHVWHDKQWSDMGFMKDAWLWFSFQLDDGTDIVCFDYLGKKMATISHRDGRQEQVQPVFEPLGKMWKSHRSQNSYALSWKIKIGKYTLITRPYIKDCEVNFGSIHYWEGPLILEGAKGRGFMEYLTEPSPYGVKDVLKDAYGAAWRYWDGKK